MDIGSNSGYPAGNLSNFTAHPFTFDGVDCASMEGLLQALKYKNPESQLTVCGLWGGHAKKKERVKTRNEKKHKPCIGKASLWIVIVKRIRIF